MKGFLDEFKAFAMRGNVIDLAVGIIIGAAFTSIVDSLVKDMINPILGLLIGGIDFSNVFVTIKGQTFPTLDAAQKAGSVTINVGLFLNACIKFVLVAFAVFVLVKNLNRLKKAEPPPPPPGPSAELKVLSEIRDALKKA